VPVNTKYNMLVNGGKKGPPNKIFCVELTAMICILLIQRFKKMDRMFDKRDQAALFQFTRSVT